jgi:hypothetical protein
MERVQRFITGPDLSGFVPTVQDGTALRSPDSSGALQVITAIYGDTQGLDAGPVSVGQSLSVPPVSRAVDLYTSVVAQQTMEAVDEAGAVLSGPDYKWLTWTEGPLSPAYRNVNLMLDLFWHRFTLLAVARNEAGYVVNGVHVPFHMWDFDAFGNIRVQSTATGHLEPVKPEDVVFIPSFKQLGFLDFAADTIRQYRSICQTLNNRADNPTPMLGIKIKEDLQPTEAEEEQALEDWAAARKSKTGATALIPAGIAVEKIGGDIDDGAMLIDTRNALRLDAANFTNLPADLLEGNSGTSGDYNNTLQSANELIKLSAGMFTRAIEARLSQDDVSPPGVKLRFNASDLEMVPAKGNVGTATPPPVNGDTPA